MNCPTCDDRGWVICVSLDRTKQPKIWVVDGEKVLDYPEKRKEILCPTCKGKGSMLEVSMRIHQEWKSWLRKEQLEQLEKKN
jgi:hypothetical protein